MIALMEIPRLKNNVRTCLFDTSSQEQAYILVFDDRRWQINKCLYNIIKLIDGKRNIKDIAIELSNVLEKEMSELDVQSVFDKFVIRHGLLEGYESTDEKSNKKSKYLWFKITLIKSSVVEKFRFLNSLFNIRVVLTTLIIGLFLHVLDFILFKDQINFKSFFSITRLNNFNFFITLIVVQFFGVFLHEFGHMSASMRYNLTPGNIGGAFYFTSPVLFADVNNVWELKRKERVVVNLGGVYFQFIVFSIACLISLLTQNSYIFISVLIGIIGMVNNFNPFLKWDGYWVVSDLLGIPNLHQTIKEYIDSILLKFFGITLNSPIQNIRKLEKNLFIIYTVLCTTFTLFFSYGLIIVFLNTSAHLFSSITILQKELTHHGIISVKDFFVNNIGVTIIFVLLIRIIYISLINLISACSRFFHLIKSKRH